MSIKATSEGTVNMEKGVFYMHADGTVKEFPAVGDLHKIAALLEKMPNVLRAWVASAEEEEEDYLADHEDWDSHPCCGVPCDCHFFPGFRS